MIVFFLLTFCYNIRHSQYFLFTSINRPTDFTFNIHLNCNQRKKKNILSFVLYFAIFIFVTVIGAIFQLRRIRISFVWWITVRSVRLIALFFLLFSIDKLNLIILNIKTQVLEWNENGEETFIESKIAMQVQTQTILSSLKCYKNEEKKNILPTSAREQWTIVVYGTKDNSSETKPVSACRTEYWILEKYVFSSVL